MAKVIIFGLLDTAELAHYYLENDSEHEVVAFTVNKEYLNVKEFRGLPVIAFEDIETRYPPEDFNLFAPMTAKQMNKLREQVYNEGKAKGYNFITYISSKATICDNEIGENCFILEDNTIQPFTKIGNNVVLWSGNHIGHHGIIKDHVFFTSHVVLSGHCIVESHCFFGVNATIRDYAHLSKGSLIAMGASLTKQETEEWGVYVGNPAKRIENKISYEVY
ncbi:acetyltransferase [Rasiella sp. SM2506]|uniref:acetyltransferase n=1 Tax=Rasiella sp. SM2506 TaxID=3423914 RepID=UPI003D7BF251